MSDTTKTVQTAPGKGKQRMSMNQAIAIMVTGGVMFVLGVLIPGENGTQIYTFKMILGILGFVVLGFGAYVRPVKSPKEELQK